MSLRKEMIIAILLGLFMGAIVALLVTEVPQRLLGLTKDDSNTGNMTPTPSPFLDEDLSMQILIPAHQENVESDTITVSGKTQPDVLVVITTAADEIAVMSDGEGAFTGEIQLAEGANELFAYSKFDGQEADQTIIVNYFEEEVIEEEEEE